MFFVALNAPDSVDTLPGVLLADAWCTARHTPKP